MGQVTLRNTKGTPLTYTEVDNNFKFCDSDTNLIINGGLNIWQRGTSFASIASNTYFADRFVYRKVGGAAGVHTASRSTDVPTQAQAGVKANFSFLLDVTTADTSITSGDNYNIDYNLEGYDYSQVEGNTYTLSFWVKGTKTGVHCVSFRNSGTDRSYVAEYTINSTATWEKKTITITFDYSGGTWDYTNGIGLRISWVLAAGSNFQTTADSWQTGNFLSTSNQVNALDSTSNDFRLALVKFEPGVEATQFRFRHFERELGYCQRYFNKSYQLGNSPGAATETGTQRERARGTEATGAVYFNFTFPTNMRSNPTIVAYSPTTGATGNIRDLTAGADLAASGLLPSEERTIIQNTSATTSGNIYSAHYTADAEL